MRHPAHAALLETKTSDQYNFGSDFSLKLNKSHHDQPSVGVTPSETTLYINELSKLSQNRSNNWGKRSSTISGNVVVAASKSNVFTTLPEINTSTQNRTDMLQNRKHQNVSTFLSQKNNSLTNVTNGRFNPNSKSCPPPQTLENANSGTSHQIPNPLVLGSSFRANLRKDAHRNGQIYLPDVRLYQDAFRNIPVNNKDKKAEIASVQSKPSAYNTVNILHNSSQSGNLLSAEVLTLTFEGVDKIEVARKSEIEAWNQFASHINMIDDLTSMGTQHFIKPFRCSSAFQAVVADMYGICDNDEPQSSPKRNSHSVNVAIYATKFLGKVRALNKFKSFPNGIGVNGRLAERSNQSGKNSVDNSKKGWGLLKQRVRDLKVQERMRQATESLDVPRQSFRDLSGLERTRRDLYERYGIIPTTRNDGTVTQENMMLSERARHCSDSHLRSSTKSRKHNSLNLFV